MNQQPRHRRHRARAPRRAALLAVAALVAVGVGATGFSSAAYTSTTTADTGTVQAASDWTLPTVSLPSPGTAVRGTIALTASASDADSVIATVTLQHRVVGGSTWTTVCTPTAAPYTCSLDTTKLANGAYDLRAVATDRAGNAATSTTVRTTIDNLAPTVTMTDPGTPLTGVKTFTATATDAHSGVAKVVIQYGTGTSFTTLCTVSAAPFSCSYDTSAIPNGTYDVRAVATDVAGNTATSAVVTGRVVANVTSTVTLADPGTYLRGTVTLRPTASSTGTITSVKIQRAPAGGSAWTDVCTSSTAPYSCSFNTTGVADGTYDLRAVLTDSTGRTTTSAVVAGRIVDNTPARGVDVQTTNGGTPGKIDAGDTIVFTYSERIALSTLVAGWDGSARSVNVRVRDGLLAGSTSFTDVLDVTGVNLGSVNLGDSFAFVLDTLNLAGTMTASTTTVNGVTATVVTIRINESGGITTLGTGTMKWTPSASVTDLAGNPTATATVTESGPDDQDF